jgi:hypothetical protein
MAVLSGICGSTGPGGQASFETKYNKTQHNIPRITVKQKNTPAKQRAQKIGKRIKMATNKANISFKIF